MAPALYGLEGLGERLRQLLRRRGAALAFICVFLFWLFLQSLSADPDLFARVAAGRLIASSGAVPLTDPFAFTPRKAVWIDHEWLSGCVFYLLSQQGGDAALFLFKCLFAMLTAALLLRAAALYAGADAPLFWPALVMSFVCAYVWTSTVRAQVFTYLFLALFLLVFAAYQRTGRRRGLLLLPAVMMIWANVHGGFAAGLGLLLICTAGMFLKGWRRRSRKAILTRPRTPAPPQCASSF